MGEYVIRISGKDRPIPRRYCRKLGRLGFSLEERAYGKSYFEKVIDEYELQQWKRFCRRAGLKFTAIPKEYTRSNDYRRVFFKFNQPLRDGRYRCAYCGRKLTKEKLTVDHIIPVKRMGESKKLQKRAKTYGIGTVNDPKNLCAACRRCNQRKSAKMGIWVLRGFLGRSEQLWKVRIFFRWVLLVAAIGFGMYLWLVQPQNAVMWN